MAAAVTRNAHSPPILNPSPSPAPSAVVSSPCTGEGRQNAPSASIKGKWQRHYNKRTTVERVNSRLKEFAKLDNLKARGLAKIRLHGLLAMLVIQAKVLGVMNI